MRSWREQAVENLQEFGEQSWVVLVLATVEEIGELAQALLHHEYENGDPERVTARETRMRALKPCPSCSPTRTSQQRLPTEKTEQSDGRDA